MRQLIIFVLSFAALSISAQDIVFYLSPSFNSAFHYRFVTGGPTIKMKPGFVISGEFIKTEPSEISMGIGLSYKYSVVEIVPAPFIEREPHKESLNLITVSFLTELNIGKNYYFSLDPLLDLQLGSKADQTMDCQTGIGLSTGLGRRIYIKNKTFISFEPTLWIHNIIPFLATNLPLRLTVIGLKFGINLKGTG